MSEKGTTERGVKNTLFLLLAFTPILLCELFTLRMLAFGIVNLVCSASAAWGLSNWNGWKCLALFISFSFLNAMVGLAQGCAVL